MHEHNGEKQCPKCKQKKLISYFGKNKLSKDGLNNVCRECRRINPIRKCKNCNKEFDVMRNGAKHLFCSEKCAIESNFKNNSFRLHNGIQKYKHYINRKYGLTNEDYDKMIKDQNSCCAICGKFEVRLCVDHNHKTGKVRKLLCRACNNLLGHSYENIIILQKAIKYLEEEYE